MAPPSDSKSLPGDEALVDGGKVMSLWEHLAELRSRLIRSMLAVAGTFAVSLFFADEIISVLKQPLVAVLPTGASALHFTGPLDVFMVDMKVAFLTGVLLACPIWIFQFWKFFEPALYPRERRFILPFIMASIAVFVLGILFCYFLILPLSLRYLIGLGMEVGTPMITIKDYVALLTVLIFGFGIVFETPIMIVLLATLNIVSLEALQQYRRFVALAILIVSALLVPPDPVSLVALALPVYGMYELAIIAVRVLKGRAQARPHQT